MGARKKRLEATYMNVATYDDIFSQLKEIALNVYRWENVPESVDIRFLELCLFNRGYAVYFNDEILGNLALNCAIGGALNVYNIPINRTAYASNGYKRFLSASDSVIIFNNYMHRATYPTIDMYAKRLTQIKRAIDVNITQQKVPKIIQCNRQQQLTFQNMYEQVDNNEPVIILDESADLKAVSVLDNTAPYVADKLNLLYKDLWNQALTFLGVENSNADKKERLVSDEVGSNYGNVEVQRNVMLNARKQAVKEINKMFGTEIEVNFNSDLITMLNSPALLVKGGSDIE
nr:MAG TPA: upper collar protein [Caudoviricetes sp.]